MCAPCSPRRSTHAPTGEEAELSRPPSATPHPPSATCPPLPPVRLRRAHGATLVTRISPSRLGGDILRGEILMKAKNQAIPGRVLSVKRAKSAPEPVVSGLPSCRYFVLAAVLWVSGAAALGGAALVLLWHRRLQRRGLAPHTLQGILQAAPGWSNAVKRAASRGWLSS